MTNLNAAQIKNFRHELYKLLEDELKVRSDMRYLYDKFMLEVRDDKIARRHVLNAYFQIQKIRLAKILADRLEFHPFFGHMVEEDDE